MTEDQGQGVDFRKYIRILKGITLAVQLMPFIYSLLYISVFLLYLKASDEILNVIDLLFYISPLFTASHLVYSRILHLCFWHRIACLIPLFPLISNIIDSSIYEFCEHGAIAVDLTFAIMVIFLLVCAYKVFFANGR